MFTPNFPAQPAGTTGGFPAAPAAFSFQTAAPGAATTPFGAAAAAPAQTGLDGDLKRLFEIRKKYAPLKDPTSETPAAYYGDAYNPPGEKYSTQTAAYIHKWNLECDLRFTMYIENDTANLLPQDQLDELEPTAIADNPDSANFQPRTYRGMAALEQLFKDQKARSQGITKQINFFTEEAERLSKLSEKRANDLSGYQKKQNEQNRRLIALLVKVEGFRCHGEPLVKAEIDHGEAYKKLAALNAQMKSHLESLEKRSLTLASFHTDDELLDISDKDLEGIYNLLKQQHNGIQQLGSVLRKDIRDVDIIYKYNKLNKPPASFV